MTRLLPLLTLLGHSALANVTFPGDVQTKYSLDGAPLCNLCHSNGFGGAGTADTRFAVAAQARGLTSNPSSLNAALDRLEADAVDSDGDCVNDIAELIAGTNPNVADNSCGGDDGGTGGGTGGGGGTGTGGGTPQPPPPLQFGCGSEVVPGLLFGASLLLLSRRRWRR